MTDITASITQIKRQAEFAAERCYGPQACQYPEGSEAASIWLGAYYAHIECLAVEAST